MTTDPGDAALDDTPETAPSMPQSRRTTDAKKARDLRDSPVFKALRKKFRDECGRQRNSDGSTGAPCHLCGDKIDYRLSHPHPQGFELDHIKTVKERPDLLMDPLNFAAAHKSCNEERGTDDPPLHLGEPSRVW